MSAKIRAMAGPNGTIEVKQLNGVQGWHSGYLSATEARDLAEELVRLADVLDENAEGAR